MKRFFTCSLILTLFMGVTSCSNSDDTIIRPEENIEVFAGSWETDELTYDIPGVHQGTFKFVQLSGKFGAEYPYKEVYKITSQDLITLSQYTEDGDLIKSYTGKVQGKDIVFEGFETRTITKANEAQFVISYPMTLMGTTAKVQVTTLKQAEMKDFIGTWKTDRLSYDIPNVHKGEHAFSDMPPASDPNRIIEEQITIALDSKTDGLIATLVQITAKGDKLDPIVSPISEHLTVEFGDSVRTFITTDRSTLYSTYKFTLFGTTANAEVSYIKL
ncbi:hypothetical protein ACYSNM_06040 [Myroides sp. LJL116]